MSFENKEFDTYTFETYRHLKDKHPDVVEALQGDIQSTVSYIKELLHAFGSESIIRKRVPTEFKKDHGRSFYYPFIFTKTKNLKIEFVNNTHVGAFLRGITGSSETNNTRLLNAILQEYSPREEEENIVKSSEKPKKVVPTKKKPVKVDREVLPSPEVIEYTPISLISKALLVEAFNSTKHYSRKSTDIEKLKEQITLHMNSLPKDDPLATQLRLALYKKGLVSFREHVLGSEKITQRIHSLSEDA